MTPGREKLLIFVLCVVGVFATAYGAATGNDPSFLLGLLLMIAGYLLLRRKLKTPPE
jgi:uncharacterized protein (TIGR03382 family)